MSQHKTFKPDSNHLMVDIETLGLQETAVPLIALAAVPFKMEEKENCDPIFLWHIKPHSETKINFNTLLFWMRQNNKARQAAFGFCVSDGYHRPVQEALEALIHVYTQYECKTIWCKGLQFDMNNIEYYINMYRDILPEKPWNYNDRLDVRAYSRLLTENEINEIYGRYNLHDPVQDCKAQIEVVRHVVNTYKNQED